MKFSFFCAVLLVVSGCSHAREEAHESKRDAAPTPAAIPTPPPAAPVADGRHVMVVFGDSISAGFGLDTGRSFPDYLQKKLDAEKQPWRVVNLGISGDTTEGGVARIDSAKSSFASCMPWHSSQTRRS